MYRTLFAFLAFLCLAAVSGGQITSLNTGPQNPTPAFPTYTPTSTTPPLSSAFYYAWWVKNQWGANTQFLPELGNYASNDPAVINQHMLWAKQAKLNLLWLSWWGQGTEPIEQRVDAVTPAILAAAAANGIQVGFHIDIYDGRTPQSVASDVDYIMAKYSQSPAFFYNSTPTPWLSGNYPRPIFCLYISVFDLVSKPSDWTATLDYIHSRYGAVMLTNAGLSVEQSKLYTAAQWVNIGHFDGSLEYSIQPTNQDSRADIMSLPANAWYIPTIEPGFNAFRSKGWTGITPRLGGQTYQQSIQRSFGLNAHMPFASLTSFNEWTESTQIEPDAPGVAKDHFVYETYAPQPADYYLTATAGWHDQLQSYASYDYSSGNMIYFSPGTEGGGLYNNVLAPSVSQNLSTVQGVTGVQSDSFNPILAFQMDRAFLGTGTSPAQITVDYLDNSNAQFRLQYWGGLTGGKEYTNYVTLTNTGGWKTATFLIPDMTAQGSLTGQSDFIIQQPSGTPLFGLVTVTHNSGGACGVVTDSVSGLPLKNVTVSAQGSSCLTNSKGQYALTSLVPGVVNLSFTKSVYTPASVPTTITLNSTASANESLTLTAGPLTGTVTGPGSAPVKSVTVTVMAANNAVMGQATTNSLGAFTLKGLAAGPITVSFSKTNYVTASNTLTTLPSVAATTNIQIQEVPGTIEGVVKSSTSALLQGATVTITGAAYGATASAGTDANGNYSIANVPPDTYSVAISDSNYQGQSITVTVGPAAIKTLNVKLTADPGSIRGTLTNAASAPLVGATVTVTKSSTPLGMASTDVSGHYLIANIPPGTYHVTFSLAAYSETKTGVVVVSNAVTSSNGSLSASSAGGLLGTVSNAAGPLQGVSVTLSSGASATTDANGDYSFANLAPGNYTVGFADAGYFPQSSTAAVNSATGATVNATLSPSTGGIAGTVSNASGHLQGVTVTLTGTATATAISDANGNYSFGSLSPGSYSVSFSDTGFLSQTTSATVTAGNTATASVTLTPSTGTISGFVQSSVDSSALVGASVSLMDVNGIALASATADSNGAYSFGALNPGQYQVAFADTGFLSQTTAETVVAGVTTMDSVQLAPTPPPTGSIAGAVFDGITLSVIPGATVSLTDGNGNLIASTTTDVNGAFSFTSIAPGAYDLSFAAQGYTGLNISTTVIANQTAGGWVNLFEIPAPTGSIAGTIQSGVDSSFIQGATVTLLDVNGVTLAQTTTDSGGNYSFASQPPASYQIQVAESGFVTQTLPATVSANVVDTVPFTLAPTPPPSGSASEQKFPK